VLERERERGRGRKGEEGAQLHRKSIENPSKCAHCIEIATKLNRAGCAHTQTHSNALKQTHTCTDKKKFLYQDFGLKNKSFSTKIIRKTHFGFKKIKTGPSSYFK